MTREEAIKRLSKYVNNGFYTIEHQETCAMAISALREQEDPKAVLVEHYIKVPEKPKWISVEERLPEKSVPVLAYKDGRIWYCERNWQSGCWESLSFAATKEYGMYWSKGPTYWMPLPEAPKEDV